MFQAGTTAIQLILAELISTQISNAGLYRARKKASGRCRRGEHRGRHLVLGWAPSKLKKPMQDRGLRVKGNRGFEDV